jgi:hypothetical protein
MSLPTLGFSAIQTTMLFFVSWAAKLQQFCEIRPQLGQKKARR